LSWWAAVVHVVPSTTTHDSLRTDTHRLPDGRTVAYTLCGDPDGAPILVHHGTPGSRIFAALLDDSAQEVGAHLVVPDRPGYGHSSPPPSDWGWSNWRADCADLLAAESLDDVATLGFSGGGPFALASAHGDRVTRVALVGAVVPPFEGLFATLARVPFALRGVFGITARLASVAGPERVVEQYTDRDVADAVARQVGAEFTEAFRQGSRAPARENRLFATSTIDTPADVSLRSWHGSEDENAPLAPVREFVHAANGSLRTLDADHLGTLLDSRREVLRWLLAANTTAT
jgi:pimeloyl-ACP methyl ester carboxylesterase